MTFQDILQAHKRIINYIHRTPVFTSSTLDNLVGRKVFFKCENLQKTGSFKARGALNAVFSLQETGESKGSGVVTHSSGNHGQALAWAAKVAGLTCSVVVPNNTPTVKTDAIKNYGANVVFCDPSVQAREEACNKVSEECKLVIVPPFDDYKVIAGQGTIALEFLEQVPELDAILVPISGGGMTSGIAIAAKAIKPSIKIFAVEPLGKDLETSLRAGKAMWDHPPTLLETVADGINREQPGQVTLPLILKLCEKQVFSINDQEMIDAMKFSMQRMKLVIEAASGAGIAAVMSAKMKKMDPSVKNIGVILCGGNTDVEKLPW